MDARQIVERGFSLADLKNSRFISKDDFNYSLNEGWRDLYSLITDSDDDYFLKTAILPMSGATALDDRTYSMPVPEDCYKIRYIDYTGGNQWIRMRRFAMAARNDAGPEPTYRWRGDRLWIAAGPTMAAPTQIRLAYYPAPERLSAPDAPIYSGALLTEAAKAAAVWPYWSETKQIMTYYTGGSLYAEPKSGAAVTLNATLVTPTHFMYHRGYLYWVRNAGLYRIATDLTAAFAAPVALAGPANVTRAFIVGQTLYWYNSVVADIYAGALDGSGGVATTYGNVDWVCGYMGDVAYLDAGVITVPAGPIAGLAATWLGSDDDQTLYYLDADHRLHRLILDMQIILSDDILYEDVGSATYYDGGRVAATGFDAPVIEALDVSANTALAYPSNMVPEILAYQCAIDFRRKQALDTADFIARRNELRQTMIEALKRDEYQPERINNYYGRYTGYR